MEPLDQLTVRMIRYNRGDPKRIQHFIKVHRFAHLIGVGEGLDRHTQWILEAAAIVHDIGVRPAEEKYGQCSGRLQEQEGPGPARLLLTQLNVPEADVERICFLVGHHHTYAPIAGPDHQMLIEADFLVNLYEDGASDRAVAAARRQIFRTHTGLELLGLLFPPEAGESSAGASF